MHPVLTTERSERREQRLATPTPTDNRVSYGCINVPKDVPRTVVLGTVKRVETASSTSFPNRNRCVAFLRRWRQRPRTVRPAPDEPLKRGLNKKPDPRARPGLGALRDAWSHFSAA